MLRRSRQLCARGSRATAGCHQSKSTPHSGPTKPANTSTANLDANQMVQTPKPQTPRTCSGVSWPLYTTVALDRLQK